MAGDKAKQKTKLTTTFERAALYAGSFNPVTKGHLHVIGHATKMTDRLVVGVGTNPKKDPLFSGAERVAMIRDDIMKNLQPELDAAGNPCRIDVIEYQGATTDVMQAEGLSVFFRGVRGVSDFNDEDTMALANADLFNDGDFEGNLQEQFTQSLIYTTTPELRKVSSSVARELCMLGKDDALLRYVTPDVRLRLIQRMDEKGMRPATDKKYNILSTEDFAALKDMWDELTPSCDRALADEIFTDVLTRYAAADRYYHNGGHLAELAAHWREFKDELSDAATVGLALFFHDVIYDAARTDNEAQSASYAASRLKDMGFDAVDITRVEDLIEMTASHNAPAGDFDAALMLDMDMAVLGAEPNQYQKYAQAVAAEYSKTYSAGDYARGRLSMFIEPSLEKENLFLTDKFRQRYQEQARRNLRAEIVTLENIISHRPSAPSLT